MVLSTHVKPGLSLKVAIPGLLKKQHMARLIKQMTNIIFIADKRQERKVGFT